MDHQITLAHGDRHDAPAVERSRQVRFCMLKMMNFSFKMMDFAFEMQRRASDRLAVANPQRKGRIQQVFEPLPDDGDDLLMVVDEMMDDDAAHSPARSVFNGRMLIAY